VINLFRAAIPAFSAGAVAATMTFAREYKQEKAMEAVSAFQSRLEKLLGRRTSLKCC
jgi:hypothetical protein